MTSRWRNPESRQDGFMIVELLVVFVVLGILTAIGYPHYMSQRERAWRATLKSDLVHAAQAEEARVVETSTYTVAEDDLRDEGYRRSDGVRPLAISLIGGGFCIKASHAQGPVYWYATASESGGLLGVPTDVSPDPANCP